MKPFWQSKTIWLNILVLLSATIDTVLAKGQVPSEVVIVLSVVNLVLRFFTKDQVMVK